MQLPVKMSSSADQSTQQWLLDKISQLHTSGQLDVTDWLQNAPDRSADRYTDQ